MTVSEPPSEPPRHPLDGVKLKVGRALEHLLALDDEIAAYRDKDPYKILREIDYGDSRLRFSYWLTEFPPPHLSVVIGDVVNNLRSALDHLAWQLVLANGGTPRSDRPATQFPIRLKQRDRSGNVRPPEVAGGVAPAVVAELDQLQPYQRRLDPEKHPLALLAELSNVDKHRTLHTTALHTLQSEVTLITTDGRRLPGTPASGPVKHGEVLAVFPLTHDDVANADPSAEIEAKGRDFLALEAAGSWGDEPVTQLLERLVKYVDQTVVPKFERFVGP